MRAIIMAGGEGKRLRPITCTMPKPMVELLNRPVIEYCVDLLRKYGIFEITATLHYLPHMIEDYLGDGAKFGVHMRYSVETEPLGTAGSVRYAADGGNEELLVISGDALTDIDLGAAIEAHQNSKAYATIVLKKVKTPMEYGVVLKNEHGIITRFLEKPMPNEVFSDLANTGIYILKPEVLRLIPERGQFDFSKDLFPLMMKQDMPIFGHEAHGYWCDIGDIGQYLAAQADLLNGRCKFEARNMVREGVYIEKGAMISEKAVLMPPCCIGAQAEIADNAVIGPETVIGAGARVGKNTSIKRSVVMRDVRIRERCELRGAIVCSGAHIESGASIFEHAAIGALSSIARNTVIAPNVCVWPQKHLEPGCRYDENVVWETDHGQNMVDHTSGYVDYDLTPERATRIGAAFAAVLGEMGNIAIATDGSQQGMMLKHALTAGAVSRGADVLDMGYCGMSQFEFAIRNLGLSGGIFVRTKAQDPHYAQLILCDAYGARLSSGDQRKFDRELEMGAHRPSTASGLGIVERTTGTTRAYEAELIRRIRLKRIPINSVSIIIAADTTVYDTVARVLLPYGFRVRFMQERDEDKLHKAMVHANAELGCIVNAENVMETVIYRDRYIDENELLTIFLLDFLRHGGKKDIVVHANVPDEYIGLLCENGARTQRVPFERSKWLKAAWQKDAYLPEIFEPEGRIIKLASLQAEGKLDMYLNALPKVYISEAETGCSWREVGRILRSLVETESDNKVELMDGVKIKSDNGWILVRPDNGFTACRIIAGSYEQEYASELCDLYLSKVRAINEEQQEKKE